jgi:hypothetical protein
MRKELLLNSARPPRRPDYIADGGVSKAGAAPLYVLGGIKGRSQGASPPTKRLCEDSGIPHTAAWGSFRFNLQERRQAVCSSPLPACGERGPPTAVCGCLQVLPTSKGPSLSQNPTHGSGWMSSSSAYIKRREPVPESHPRQWVDVFKFCLHQKARACARIPPTAVGGCLQVLPTSKGPSLCQNPTHGSGWMSSSPGCDLKAYR